MQGFGNVGAWAAQIFQEHGGKVTAASDAFGATRNEGGLDIPALRSHLATGAMLADFPGGTHDHASVSCLAGWLACLLTYSACLLTKLMEPGAVRITITTTPAEVVTRTSAKDRPPLACLPPYSLRAVVSVRQHVDHILLLSCGPHDRKGARCWWYV